MTVVRTKMAKEAGRSLPVLSGRQPEDKGFKLQDLKQSKLEKQLI